jgi:hypothetical protein
VSSELADLPGAAVQDVIIFIDAADPGRIAAVTAEERQHVPAAACRATGRVERHHGLQHEMRIQATVGKSELPAAHLLEEQLPDGFAVQIACGIVGNRVLGEEVGEIVPEPELDVVAVGVLQTLDRAE